jgi:hypothetical protein
MRCNPSARWGPGTTTERPCNTESARDIRAKMDQMLKEREKQDTMWVQHVEKETQDPPEPKK